MSDRSPRETKVTSAGAAARAAPNRVARFVVGQRAFQLVLCHQKDRLSAAEVAQFSLGEQILVVVEDQEPDKFETEMPDVVAALTERELQIAVLVAQGDATKNIAYKLRISEWTVGTHLRRIFAKLHVDNRAAMVFLCASAIEKATATTSGNGTRKYALSPAGGSRRAPHCT